MGSDRVGRRITPWLKRSKYIAQGYGWVIDLDLEKFFDRVNHDKLMGQIAKRVEDKRLLKLIRAFLNAGVMENGLVSPSVEGTPQGGPLSPLLSNLVLDELDRELERRGHRFVRYADDCNIYVRSERAGQRVMESISRFITQKLKLKVNEAKSAVARPQERKFLGFSFTAGPDIKRTIAPKSLERFKQRIRDTTRRAKGVSIKTTMEELATYMRGWRGYFGFCETPEVLIALTRWVRLRLRAALWRQWKTPRRRRAALIANGVSEWACKEHGRQRPRSLVSRPQQSPLYWALKCILQIARPAILVPIVLAQPSRTAVYGPVRTVVWEGRSREAPPYPDAIANPQGSSPRPFRRSSRSGCWCCPR
jgi:hypothetical protein